MKKVVFAALALAAPVAMIAQSATDIYDLNQSDIRGTARFMSMGGAFTALGGDLSTLTQNPAGIGVYRRSEIGVTLDISPRSTSALTNGYKMKMSSTPVSCNNFGYVGSVRLGGDMETFSWGASYNRVANFNRKFAARYGSLGTSLSNYIADYTTASGVFAQDMEFGTGSNRYDPYYDSNIDWLSILAYNSYMIEPNGSNTAYRGLFQNGTTGNGYSEVHENGYIDEYAIDFGGNVKDVVMWGIGFGITDLKLNRTTFYSESLDNAAVINANGYTSTGTADFDLTNYRSINGTGFNLKVGLIFKPINELRIGVAFHTPTWYTLTNSAYAETAYSYTAPVNGKDETVFGDDYTGDAYYNFRMTSPWKFMVGAAAVLGSSAIVSADYEYQAYNKMRSSYQSGFGDYTSDEWVNADIEDYYKAANIFRVGLEYRVTPSFSVRAGYNYTSSTASTYAENGGEIITAGTDPSFTLNRGANAVSIGLGYRYKAFYIDGCYVYRSKKSTYKAFTDFGAFQSPSANLTENTNSIVFSAGFKF